MISFTHFFAAFLEPTQQQTLSHATQVLNGAEPSPGNVQDMRFLQAVVLEVLRLRPPAYIVGRCAASDVTLGAHQLPKGSCRPRACAPQLSCLMSVRALED